jgi:hypothetical protein
VLQIYKKRTADNTLNFLEKVMEQMPFPVQPVQTDRGMEFFAEKVQRRLYGIRRFEKWWQSTFYVRFTLTQRQLDINS